MGDPVNAGEKGKKDTAISTQRRHLPFQTDAHRPAFLHPSVNHRKMTSRDSAIATTPMEGERKQQKSSVGYLESIAEQMVSTEDGHGIDQPVADDDPVFAQDDPEPQCRSFDADAIQLRKTVTAYSGLRDEELLKIEKDARNERGPDNNTLQECGRSSPFRDISDGTLLTNDGMPKADAAPTSSDGNPPFQTKFLGMDVLGERSARAGFDGWTAPFTIRDLHAVKETPDLTRAKLVASVSRRDAAVAAAQQQGAAPTAAQNPAPPPLCDRDLGQFLGQGF